MARKLYAFASGECMAESADSPMNQEILLGGHFYLMVLKVCFQGTCSEVLTRDFDIFMIYTIYMYITAVLPRVFCKVGIVGAPASTWPSLSNTNSELP